MKLLGITDLHDSPAAFARILAGAGPIDAVLLGGDITNFGSPADAERLVRQAQAAGAPVLAVAGNCDSAEIDRRLVGLGVSLFARGVILQDVALHGLSAMPPWHQTMYHFSEDELAEHLQAGYAQIMAKTASAPEEGAGTSCRNDPTNRPCCAWCPSVPGASHKRFPTAFFHIVLSHPPPRDGKLDRVFSGRHAGSTALRAFIERAQPALVVCGHIHEGRGIDTLGQTTVVNCGPAAAGSYALIELGDDLRVELCKA